MASASPRRAPSGVALAGLLAVLACGPSLESEEREMTVLARSERPVTLEPGTTVVALRERSEPLAGRLGALEPGRSVYLVVRGLAADRQPGVLYAAYLDLPPGASPAPNDPRQAGLIHFFHARPPGAAAPGTSAPGADDQVFFSFDVTALVRGLSARGELADPTTVTLIADGVPEPRSNVSVRQIQIVAQ